MTTRSTITWEDRNRKPTKEQKKELFLRETRYQLAVHFLRNERDEGKLTMDEYKKARAEMARRFHPALEELITAPSLGDEWDAYLND